ncbi:MAG: type II toxin-antitoxin system VapC family toxin [Phormidesmis sp.]
MNNLFVDTAGWANLFIVSEEHHKKAAAYIYEAQRTRQKLATTNYIVAELVALLGSRYQLSRQQVFRYVDSIKKTPSIQIFHIDELTDTEAWKLCKSRPDEAWSLVDSSSFIVMKQLFISTALTTDKHFEQAGFVHLLK